MIETFVDENPGNFTDDELEIIKSWHELVAGDFSIFRYLKKYTVFLSTDNSPIAYGVLALTQPFEELVGPCLPVLINTVPLPFKDQIIYDSLLSGYPISFGGGIRAELERYVRISKATAGNRHVATYHGRAWASYEILKAEKEPLERASVRRGERGAGPDR